MTSPLIRIHLVPAPLMTLAIQIDAASAVPVHRQIYEAWRRGILMGRFAAGGRGPSPRGVGGALAGSPSTGSQAHDQLVSEGYFEAGCGPGNAFWSGIARAPP